MEYLEIINEALLALAVNKLRSGLAVLGIVIGIGSVIVLISLGQSSQKAVAAQIQSLGANLLTVIPGAQSTGFVRGAAGGAMTLTFEDAKAIKTSPSITTIKNVSPEFSRRAQVSTGRKNTNTQILGVTPAYLEVRKLNLSSGNFISEQDVDSMAKVAVLGPQVVIDLFGEEANPVGNLIRINNQSFRVIGVTRAKGGTGFTNQDDIVFVPLTTAQKIIFGADYLTSISLEAQSEEVMLQAQDEVGYLLLSRHKLKDPLSADFTIFSQSDILGAASQVTNTFTSLLSGIAAISLLVGGIGIMNIMLVTVTERTKEIGLRKALGAKKKIIIVQFLTEAIILTFTGGLLGITLGIGISYFFVYLLELPFVLSLHAIFLALVVSGTIGILFGYYPAKKAAGLSPIEALRYE